MKSFFDGLLDTLSGEEGTKKWEFFETWKNPPRDFALDLYALYMARKANLNIVRFDVLFPERQHGQSHWNNGSLKAKWKFIKRTLDFSVKLKRAGIE